MKIKKKQKIRIWILKKLGNRQEREKQENRKMSVKISKKSLAFIKNCGVKTERKFLISKPILLKVNR